MPAPLGYVPEALEALTAPHIDSFDYFLSDGLRLVVQGLAPIEACSPLPLPPTPPLSSSFLAAACHRACTAAFYI